MRKKTFAVFFLDTARCEMFQFLQGKNDFFSGVKTPQRAVSAPRSPYLFFSCTTELKFQRTSRKKKIFKIQCDIKAQKNLYFRQTNFTLCIKFTFGVLWRCVFSSKHLHRISKYMFSAVKCSTISLVHLIKMQVFFHNEIFFFELQKKLFFLVIPPPTLSGRDTKKNFFAASLTESQLAGWYYVSFQYQILIWIFQICVKRVIYTMKFNIVLLLQYTIYCKIIIFI